VIHISLLLRAWRASDIPSSEALQSFTSSEASGSEGRGLSTVHDSAIDEGQCLGPQRGA
jgi:hypothetical protein